MRTQYLQLTSQKRFEENSILTLPRCRTAYGIDINITSWACKNAIWVGAGTEIRTQYLLTLTAPSGPVGNTSLHRALVLNTAPVHWRPCWKSNLISVGERGYKTRREARNEMFYLTTHSTHFILRLYDIGHMVKDHSDSERGNPLPPHGLLFPINSNGSFICTIPQTG